MSFAAALKDYLEKDGEKAGLNDLKLFLYDKDRELYIKELESYGYVIG